MAKVLPVFNSIFFIFKNDNIPEHTEGGLPLIPNYADLYTVFSTPSQAESRTLAVDIDSEFAARVIAEANVKYQRKSIKRYGYSDDVYVGFPDGKNERVYIGIGPAL